MACDFVNFVRFVLTDVLAVRVEEHVDRTGDAPPCSFMYLLTCSFDDGINILGVAGHLSHFASVFGVLVPAYAHEWLSRLVSYGSGKVLSAIFPIRISVFYCLFDFSLGFGEVLLCKFFVCFSTPGELRSMDPVVEVTLLHLLEQFEHLFTKLIEFFECTFPVWFLVVSAELAFPFSLVFSFPACFDGSFLVFGEIGFGAASDGKVNIGFSCVVSNFFPVPFRSCIVAWLHRSREIDDPVSEFGVAVCCGP